MIWNHNQIILGKEYQEYTCCHSTGYSMYEDEEYEEHTWSVSLISRTHFKCILDTPILILLILILRWGVSGILWFVATLLFYVWRWGVWRIHFKCILHIKNTLQMYSRYSFFWCSSFWYSDDEYQVFCGLSPHCYSMYQDEKYQEYTWWGVPRIHRLLFCILIYMGVSLYLIYMYCVNIFM